MPFIQTTKAKAKAAERELQIPFNGFHVFSPIQEKLPSMYRNWGYGMLWPCLLFRYAVNDVRCRKHHFISPPARRAENGILKGQCPLSGVPGAEPLASFPPSVVTAPATLFRHAQSQSGARLSPPGFFPWEGLHAAHRFCIRRQWRPR